MEDAIYNQDCITGLARIPDESIDCIITDPPYGDNQGYGRENKEIENNQSPITNCQFLERAYRIMKPNTVLWNFTNWKHYSFLAEHVRRYTKFNIRHLVVWKKGNIGMGYGFRNQYELILVLEKGKPQYLDGGFSNVQETKVIIHDGETHPHMKPVELIRKMLLHTTKKGDVVLDAFFGSGAVLVACKQLERKFIGFEIDQKYYELAKERLNTQPIGLSNYM